MGRLSIKDVSSPQTISHCHYNKKSSVESDKIILKFIWEIKSPTVANTILKENKATFLTDRDKC